jgi:limonene-1,2-epoxide hydrolase
VHPFRAAIEARDIDAAVALFSDQIAFHSPIAFAPYRGRDATAMILRAVLEVFQGFRYEREIGAPDAADHALVFRARVGERQLEGCDFLHVGDDGLIDELTVMVRPLNAAVALADAMKAQLAGGPAR